MATERVLSNLNLISFKTESGLQNHIDELQDGDLVFTPDNSLKGTLLDFKWADHLLNDMSWLRADTFSWQSGDVYVAAYNHLLDDLKGIGCNYGWLTTELKGACTTIDRFPEVGTEVYTYSSGATGTLVKAGLTVVSYDKATDELVLSDGTICTCKSYTIPAEHRKTETIGDITITFYLADDGHKICPDSEEDKVLSIYNKTGNAWYYIIDTINQRFKLPRRHSQQIVRSVKNADGSWYRLYADGWVEQGGNVNGSTSQTATFPIAMADTNYTVAYGNISGTYEQVRTDTKTTTSITIKNANNGGTVSTDWQVSGQSAIDTSPFQDSEKHLYFYVGNFEKEAIEQTAGVTTETLNGKADSDLGNIPANYDYVVESQLPTEANGYTWYRKYKSGWVEQGGYTKIVKVALPVEMLNSKEYTALVQYNPVDGDISNGAIIVENKTTTGFDVQRYSSGTDEFSWQVSGVSAQ